MAIFNWFKKNKKNKDEDNSEELELNVDLEEIEGEIETDTKVEEDIILESDITSEINYTEDVNESKTEEEPQVIENLQNKVFDTVAQEVQEVQEAQEAQEIQEEPEVLIEKIEEIDTTEVENLEEIQVIETPQDKPKKQGFFQKIKNGLAKTRDNLLSGVEQALSTFTKIDEELFEELEEVLIMSDIGVDTSVFIMQEVRKIVKLERIQDVSAIKDVIARVITKIMEENNTQFELQKPSVLLIIGVNGVGKTTTIGKLCNLYKTDGWNVILGAGDTFRAAAIDQLQVWGERNSVDVIKHQENSDPAAVVFDAVKASKARNADLLICDTAGRLHNKKNLMEELKKISKVISREYPEAQVETLLVLDATTGQNALQQAKLFSEVADITGLVLTKLDGTAKGGVIISIKNQLNIPVRFIGVGEQLEDLRPFDASEFAKALFD